MTRRRKGRGRGRRRRKRRKRKMKGGDTGGRVKERDMKEEGLEKEEEDRRRRRAEQRLTNSLSGIGIEHARWRYKNRVRHTFIPNITRRYALKHGHT